MKTIQPFMLMASLAAGILICAAQESTNTPPQTESAAQVVTNTAADPQTTLAPKLEEAVVASTNGVSPPVSEPGAPTPPAAIAAQVAPPATSAVATAPADENGAKGLRLNFRGAPLELVLNYFSDAAGFIINAKTPVGGKVDVWSKDPLTRDEAVKVLTTVLGQNGYGVIRDGRLLTIISHGDPKQQGTPVKVARKFEDIPKDNEMVTEIIPVHFANASQLVGNLQQLLPTTASLTANDSANTLIIVDTQAAVRRMVEIVTALDTSIANVSSIRVIPLEYADAKETATLITQLFTPQGVNAGPFGANNRANLFQMMAGGGRNRGGGTGTGTPGSGAAATRVVAVGDDRSNSLVVSAPADLLTTITEMVDKIDQPVTDVTELRVFHLVNADPSELADQFTALFADQTGTGSANANQNQRGFVFGGRGGRGGAATAASGSSDRTKKMGRVLAVPDARTSSLIVTASKTLMPQIAEMVAELDASPAKKEIVSYYELHDADPIDVQQALQDLFNRSTVRMQNSQNSRSMMGQGNPLLQRQTQNQQNTTGGAGSFGRSGGSTMGGGF